MFKKVLIANRGEIALRVIRACRELGVHTVAIYSTADRDSLHARFADEHVCIGPGPLAESYLNIPRVMSAAAITGADALHPGYGLMSENAEFAELCATCKLTFIGPSPKSITLMGDKAQARETMRQAGVPVAPGSEGPVETFQTAQEWADQIGYPVLLKAAAGGGGRGIRLVQTPDQLEQVFKAAQTEAVVAFKDGSMFLEKYIVCPRHVEIQVLADQHGNHVHLGERDCSLQRRHQKVVEESPAPNLPAETRQSMGEAAIKCVEAAGYYNAGTVEFIMDPTGRFYFIEMNTRVQVEHPVTEMVTGVDIVKTQILIAAGERLPFRQEDVTWTGHAIECRINAEDPNDGFRPRPGRLTAVNIPGGPGMRVDTHIYTEYAMPQYYDSLMAKLIAHGGTRAEAIARMSRALEEFVIEGVPTTIPFCRKVLASAWFRRGEIHTEVIREHAEELFAEKTK